MSVRTTSASYRAGCLTCHGQTVAWTAKNAMVVAARHAAASGHATWAEQVLSVRFGEHQANDLQADLFPSPTSEDAHVA